jgi:hypothetical protein
MSDLKTKVIDAIKNLPDDITYDDILETIYVQQKVEIGLQQSEEGNVIPHEEVEEKILRRFGKSVKK